MPDNNKSEADLPIEMSPADELSLAEDMAIDEVLADLDEPETRKGPSPELLDLAKNTRAAIIDDAKKNGWISQAYNQIDTHRAGKGREQHNANMRAEYSAKIQETENRKVRSYNPSSLEKRREQNKLASKRSRAKKARANPPKTAAEIEDKRTYERMRKQKQRQKKKEQLTNEAEIREIERLFDAGELEIDGGK